MTSDLVCKMYLHSVTTSSSSSSSLSSSPSQSMLMTPKQSAALSSDMLIASSSSSNASRALNVELTSETNPFFFYSMRLSEEEFASLRRSQDLLVEFSGFPAYLVGLLKRCSSSSSSASSPSPSSSSSPSSPAPPAVPKFLLTLCHSPLTYSPEAGAPTSSLSLGKGPAFSAVGFVAAPAVSEPSLLRFIETNQFKHIQHLSLPLTRGDDQALKTYLAERLHHFKSLSANLRASLDRALEDLQRTTEAKAALQETLRRHELSAEQRLLEASSAHAAALSALKGAHFTELKAESAAAKEREEALAGDYRAQLAGMQTQLVAANARVQELVEGKADVEKQLHALEVKYASTSQELLIVKTEIQVLQDAHSQLQEESTKTSKALTQEKLTSFTLEQKLAHQTMAAEQSAKLVAGAEAHSKQLEASLALFTQANEKYEQQVKSSFAEIEKANKIITFLQSELRLTKQRNKSLRTTSSDKEATVTQLEKDLIATRAELEKVAKERDARNEHAASLEERLSSAQRALDETKKTVAEQEAMIKWLNDEANNTAIYKLSQVASVGRPSATLPSASMSSFSSTSSALVPSATSTSVISTSTIQPLSSSFSSSVTKSVLPETSSTAGSPPTSTSTSTTSTSTVAEAIARARAVAASVTVGAAPAKQSTATWEANSMFFTPQHSSSTPLTSKGPQSAPGANAAAGLSYVARPSPAPSMITGPLFPSPSQSTPANVNTFASTFTSSSSSSSTSAVVEPVPRVTLPSPTPGPTTTVGASTHSSSRPTVPVHNHNINNTITPSTSAFAFASTGVTPFKSTILGPSFDAVAMYSSAEGSTPAMSSRMSSVTSSSSIADSDALSLALEQAADGSHAATSMSTSFTVDYHEALLHHTTAPSAASSVRVTDSLKGAKVASAVVVDGMSPLPNPAPRPTAAASSVSAITKTHHFFTPSRGAVDGKVSSVAVASLKQQHQQQHHHRASVTTGSSDRAMLPSVYF